MTDNAPSWQPDPTGRFEHRYWDGSQWTDHVSNAGVASTDAYTADEAPGWGDPTVSQPTAPGDPTTAWPVAPLPPGLTPPVPPIGSPAGAGAGRSKKSLVIGAAALVAVAAVVAALLLTGGNDNSERDRIRADLAAQLNDGGNLSQDQANCLSDAIIDDLGTDKLKDVDFSASQPPADIEDELYTSALAGLDKCNVDAAALVNPTDTTDTTGGSIGSGTDLPANFERQLADVYEKNMGLPREKARCLAGKIHDAIKSGRLSQEQAMSDIFGYFSDCNIDMSELNGN